MLVPMIATAALAFVQIGGTRNEVYNGRMDRIAVNTPRLEGTITVDGTLSEPVWARAALLTGFSQYHPVDGLPAGDSTEILVWYDDTAIHLGVRAFEPHGAVNATLADRDRIGGDDQVQIFLDTFNDRRRALVFSVNPLGVQADGVWSEGSTNADGTALDASPDFVFESRGRITGSGYEVEIRIPFKSIRYQAAGEQTWGINILRRVQHSGHQQTWTAARLGNASFLAQSGTLEGLAGLERGLVLDLTPVVTARVDGAYDADRQWVYDRQRPQVGANVRWGITENVTLNGTINPDFSHVESDAGQLSFDPRQSLFFPEKRPFFLEGSETFAAPNRLIYTRRIADPVTAAKVTANLGGTNVGLISAVDERALSYSGTDHPVYSIVRLRRDVGRGSTMGVVYTDRIDGDHYNRVAAADARFVIDDTYTINLQGGASFTRAPGLDEPGRPIFQVAAARRGRAFNVSANVNGTHTGFRALSGFLGRTGIVNASVSPSYTVYGRPGNLVESWTGSIMLSGTWKYDRFVDVRPADDQKLHFNSNFALRDGWSVGTAFFLESFKYPEELYTDYFIDLGSDTVPYVGTDRITNYDVVVSLNSPQFQTFSAYAFVAAGRDENFEEWAPAWIFFPTVNAEWRPTEQLRVEGSWSQQRFHRYDDRSLVLLRNLPRLELEYQFSRSIFIRLVGEYQAEKRAALHDDTRTERPILRRLPGDVFVPELAYAQSGFDADWLFSYQPSPGTVLFLGYGNTLASFDTYGFSRLSRAADGFFVKLSYQFRM